MWLLCPVRYRRHSSLCSRPAGYKFYQLDSTSRRRNPALHKARSDSQGHRSSRLRVRSAPSNVTSCASIDTQFCSGGRMVTRQLEFYHRFCHHWCNDCHIYSARGDAIVYLHVHFLLNVKDAEIRN